MSIGVTVCGVWRLISFQYHIIYCFRISLSASLSFSLLSDNTHLVAPTAGHRSVGHACIPNQIGFSICLCIVISRSDRASSAFRCIFRITLAFHARDSFISSMLIFKHTITYIVIRFSCVCVFMYTNSTPNNRTFILELTFQFFYLLYKHSHTLSYSISISRLPTI